MRLLLLTFQKRACQQRRPSDWPIVPLSPDLHIHRRYGRDLSCSHYGLVPTVRILNVPIQSLRISDTKESANPCLVTSGRRRNMRPFLFPVAVTVVVNSNNNNNHQLIQVHPSATTSSFLEDCPERMGGMGGWGRGRRVLTSGKAFGILHET